MSKLEEIQSALGSMESPKKAAALMKHFKAGPGEYACGDKFLGVDMANQRTVAKDNFVDISYDELSQLMRSEVHEYRMTSLLMMTYKFAGLQDEETRKELVDFYVDHLDFVNNWDLVDTTAERILGVYLLEKERELLIEMAGSRRLWRERIALLASQYFVKNNDFNTTFEIVEILLQHPHPLIHQAVGKVFAEMVKRDAEQVDNFLSKHYKKMSRGMLKGALASFSENRQRAYMSGNVKPQ